MWSKLEKQIVGFQQEKQTLHGLRFAQDDSFKGKRVEHCVLAREQ